MQHYVATRPMFIDVEIMNADNRLVLGEQGSQANPSNVARGLSSLYKEIAGWFFTLDAHIVYEKRGEKVSTKRKQGPFSLRCNKQ